MFPPRLVVGTTLACALLCLAAGSAAMGQANDVHYQHHAMMPPGAIGNWQLLRGGPLPGWFQPVEIKAPHGALISLAEAGAFSQPKRPPLKVGLLIGQVYRLKVMNIPLHEGQEVFPTIELIDRTYAPPGQELRFPIPIDLTYEDLQLALAGKFVTRVVYLEDPRRALPVAEDKGGRRWFEVAAGQDPLAAADLLGRPVAIIRLGGRAPDRSAPDAKFLFGCPPVQHYAESQQAPAPNSRRGDPAAEPQPTPAVKPPKPNGKPPKPNGSQSDRGDSLPARPEADQREKTNGAGQPQPTPSDPADATQPDGSPKVSPEWTAEHKGSAGSSDAAHSSPEVRARPEVRVLPPPPGRKVVPTSVNRELQ